MRHSSTRALYAIWDRARGSERAPQRADLPPHATRTLLGDMFEVGVTDGAPLGFAGTRVAALLGLDGRGARLPDLFAPESRDELSQLVEAVGEELLVAVAGVSGTCGDGHAAALEMTVLPFRGRAHAPLSLMGLLVPLLPSHWPVRALTLTSWRYLGHESSAAGPRPLRKLAPSRGLTVYEGLRGKSSVAQTFGTHR